MIRRVSALLVALAFVGAPVGPAWGEDDLLGDGFEEFTGIPRDVAVPLSDDEMDHLRGRFFEVFFGIEFFGRAAVDGTFDAGLDVSVSFVDPATGAIQTGSLAFPNGGAGSAGTLNTPSANGATVADVTNPVTGDVFRIANVIDNSFGNGGNFQAQVIQNNGPGASLQNIAIMNIAILNVVDSEAAATRAALANLFGTVGGQ